MAGGNKKIHEHPNAGKNSLRHRPQDINRTGLNRRYCTAAFIKENGHVEGLTKRQYYDAVSKMLEMTETDLKELEQKSDTPIWMKFTIKDLMNPKKRQKLMTEMFDRLYGKAKEEYVINGDLNHTVTPVVAPIQVVIDGEPK